MKVTNLLLCGLGVLCIAACKKKKTTSQNIATPNVTNTIDSTAVAAHWKIDTYDGTSSETWSASETPISFSLVHISGGRTGAAIFKCNRSLQVEDILYGEGPSLSVINDTIQYTGAGYYRHGRMEYTITGSDQPGDSILVTWTYTDERHPSDVTDHHCFFKGRRMN